MITRPILHCPNCPNTFTHTHTRKRLAIAVVQSMQIGWPGWDVGTADRQRLTAGRCNTPHTTEAPATENHVDPRSRRVKADCIGLTAFQPSGLPAFCHAHMPIRPRRARVVPALCGVLRVSGVACEAAQLERSAKSQRFSDQGMVDGPTPPPAASQLEVVS
ncbi:MAG: hypothetical protein RL385_5698 [Pseudomonadota bacterium]|jgi:hypothetical protein